MKYHEEDTITTTKEVTKITTTRIRIAITVKRIGTRITRVPTRRRMTKRNPKTPSDLLRGHRVEIMHALCMYTQLNTMCH